MKDSPIDCQFVQADQSHLDYLTQATIQLHLFESENDSAKLQVNDDFSEKVREWIKLEIDNPASLIFIIHDASTTLGFAFLKILPSQNEFTQYQSFGLIQSIWIEPEFRKQDLGRKTVDLIESIFIEQAIPYYEVNYSTMNQSAKTFWEKCGMTSVAVTARKFLSD